MEASLILQNLADRYSQCHTYSDSGIVDFDDVHGKKEQIEFRTCFIRPGYFSFEWQDYGPNRGKSTDFSTLWSMDGKIRTPRRWGVKENKSLSMAIAGATGCSAGSAHIVPPLLLEDLRRESKHLLQLTDLQVLRNEVLDDSEYYVLQGALFKPGDHILWISTNDFALHRVYVDHSSTAEESRREYEEIVADKKLMALLSEKGMALPTNIEHKDRRSTAQYTYSKICFDAPIEPLPEPAETN
jgi:hypothetical protein